MPNGEKVEWLGKKVYRTSPGCFICGGEHLEFAHSLIMPVNNKQSGQNIVDMFQSIGARLDYWPQDIEEKFVQVVISTCDKHLVYLDILSKKINDNQRIITPEIIKETQNYQIDKFEIQKKDGITINSNIIIRPASEYRYLRSQYQCFICDSDFIISELEFSGNFSEISKLFNDRAIVETSEYYNIHILSCNKHAKDLRHLEHVIKSCDYHLNPEVIAKCIHDSKLSQLDKKFNCHECHILLSQ